MPNIGKPVYLILNWIKVDKLGEILWTYDFFLSTTENSIPNEKGTGP